MNLMFRKNFREGAGKSSSGGGGGIKLTSKANRSQGKRSRDMGYGNLDADVHYRTHLFFSPNRGFNSNNFEGLCNMGRFVVAAVCSALSIFVCICVSVNPLYLSVTTTIYSVYICPSIAFKLCRKMDY